METIKKEPCNICKTPNILEKDHVPPRCCSNKGKVNYYKLFDLNFQPNKKPRQAQKGIQFKTICGNCNNNLLGKKLDPSLGNFQNNILNEANKCASFSDNIDIKCRINKVCRAVIGHLLAALPYYLDSDAENELREYFFNESKNKIEGQHLYFWIQCENRVAISRSIGIYDHIFNGSVISLLKFPGAAFMLCDKCVDDGFIDLFEYTTKNIEDEIDLEIQINSIYSKTGEPRITEYPLIENDNRIFVATDESLSNTLFSTLLNFD